MKKQHLLFITQYFYPENFKGNDIAFDLVQRGVDVTVITGIPNYPSGKFYKGYGLFKKTRETINGVHIIRIPLVPRGSNSIMLMLNYFSFAFFASIFTFFHCLLHKYDSCFIQQLSPITIALPGIIFKKLTHKPLSCWVLDLWPESLQSAGGVHNKMVLSFFDYIASMMYRNSDNILISSRGFEDFIAKKGDFKYKISYFPNWADHVLNHAFECNLPAMPVGFRVMFAGNIGEAQDFNHLVEAAKLLSLEDEIKLIIIGDGRKKMWVDEQIVKYKLENVMYMFGRYPIESMPAFFRMADVMLVSLKNEIIFNLTAPAKIQAYMSVEKPIVAMMNGEGAAIVRDAQCGIIVPAESPIALVEALKQIKNLTAKERTILGINGRNYCETHFDKDRCLTNLYNLLFCK
ncbi:MAG: glycosyltransferase family 4 protein [Acinetobacter sp.]